MRRGSYLFVSDKLGAGGPMVIVHSGAPINSWRLEKRHRSSSDPELNSKCHLLGLPAERSQLHGMREQRRPNFEWLVASKITVASELTKAINCSSMPRRSPPSLSSSIPSTTIQTLLEVLADLINRSFISSIEGLFYFLQALSNTSMTTFQI